MTAFDVGDVARIGNHTATAKETADGTTVTREAFKDSAHAAFDPTTVTLAVRTPAGVTTTYTYGGSPALTKEAAQTGRYYADVPLTLAGTWHYRLFGSSAGGVQTAAVGSLIVRPDPTA